MSLGIYNSNAFQNAAGVQVVALANVEVRRESDGGLASIFSDRAGTAVITQVAFPGTTGFKADANGYFEFFAAGGESYKVRAYNDAATIDKTVRYQATGTAREVDIDPTVWVTILAASTLQAAREAMGIRGDAGIGKVPIGDGAQFIQGALSGFAILNGYLDWTVAGNVLTVAVKTWAGADPDVNDPVYIAFRDATPATGLPLIRKLTAATSISINDTALLGTINATAFRLWCVAFDDGGTVRLALINCLSGTAPNFNIFPLAGWGIASSTLEDNASDSAAVFYSSGAAVASKAYAVLGYATWESGLATAGTWSAGPTRAQLFGPGVPLPGARFNQVREQTGAVATGTTVLPTDDTIPQSGEGDEYMDVVHAATSAANLVEVEHIGWYAGSVSNDVLSCSLIQDSVANAIAAGYVSRDNTAAYRGAATLKHQLRAPGVSTTYNIRVGSSGASTTTFNGVAGARHFGGVLASSLTATEIMV